MLIWAAERPERDALVLPEGVELASVPRQPGDHPDLPKVEVLVPPYRSRRVLEAGDRLWSAPNLLLTPHMAGDTPRRYRRSWEIVGEQVERLLDGRPLENVVRS